MANNTKSKRLQKLPQAYARHVHKDLKDLSEVLKKARKERKISQAELAEMIDVSPTTVQGIERMRTGMSLELFLTLIKALQIKLVVG